MGLIWEGNIKMVLQEVDGGQETDWCDSENGQMAGSCECGNELSVSIKYRNCLKNWETVSFSRRITPYNLWDTPCVSQLVI
jgi:hypothetical protein